MSAREGPPAHLRKVSNQGGQVILSGVDELQLKFKRGIEVK